MIAALIADVHSNLPALRAVIADARERGAQQLIFCGDYICDGPDTAEVIDLVKNSSELSIRGNREQYMLDHRNGLTPQWDRLQYRSLLWIYDRLTTPQLDWFSSLPSLARVTLGGFHLNISHGSPYRQRDNLRPVGTEAVFRRMISDFGDDVYIFAHTHRQFHTVCDGRLFVNPGSAGMPTDSPGYKYSLLRLGEITQVEEIAVPYDYAEVCDYYESFGFSRDNGFWAELFKLSLRDNIDYMPRFVGFLHNYAKRRGVADTAAIPDELCGKAADEYRRLYVRRQQ